LAKTMKVAVSAGVLLNASALATLGSVAPAQEITETMGKPLRATLASSKQPVDLEFCVADAITQVGGAIPIPIHDGPDKTLMLGYGHTPKLVVVMTKVATGTELKVFTKSGDVDDRFVEYVKTSCKIS